MREWLQQWWVKLGLGVILLIIWILNIHSFLKLSSGDDTKTVLPKLEAGEMIMNVITKKKEDIFRAGFRDPFQPQIRLRTPRVNPSLPEKSQVKKDPFSDLQLIGIMEKRVILKNKSQGVFFLSMGDTVDGVRILRVGRDSVVLAAPKASGQKEILKITYKKDTTNHHGGTE